MIPACITIGLFAFFGHFAVEGFLDWLDVK